jgi:hypothetical protein
MQGTNAFSPSLALSFYCIGAPLHAGPESDKSELIALEHLGHFSLSQFMILQGS